MIGIDLSEAIEAAYKNGRDLPVFHTVQADIFNLPFRDYSFDFAQSLGVLHHTPDPEKALQSVVGKIRPGGNVFLMLYQTFEEHNKLKHWLLKAVNLIRCVTAKMPPRALYVALYLMLPIVLMTCYGPSYLLWYLPGTRRWSSKLPYNYEQYRKRRLRDFHMNLFDRFGNPIERRYRRAEMEDWMRRSFLDFDMRAKDGWLISGRTSFDASSEKAA
jgi:SAM-dependent methyltransferase